MVQYFGFFTMEYVAGGSLDQFWRSFGQGFIPAQTVVDILKQVCQGLAVAHSQDPPIVHRDIKPQNILIGYDKERPSRQDFQTFGLAKQVNPLTLMASARGTRCFKSPEAFDDFNSDSCSGDVWAIGTTMYLLLTDKLPFELPDDASNVTSRSFEKPPALPSRLNVLSDSRLDRIATRCLSVDPRQRYQTAMEVLADLDRWTPHLSAEPTLGSDGRGKYETLQRSAR